MKNTPVTCGYVPLVDSAPLIIAKELRFAADEGIDLSLDPQPSWSALRDRLSFGQFDFAHMLSAMPIAMALGLGGAQTQIDALMVLAVNGNVIGASATLAERMQATGWVNSFDNPAATSATILAVTDTPLRIGVPFPFSMHRLVIEYWLKKDPAFDPANVEIITIPPPQMADSLRDKRIDMFCVGEPWGSVAVQNSGATLVLPSAAIWQYAPEKVLAARHDWIAQNTDTSCAMIRAVYKAAQWLAQPTNTPLAVEILASSAHLDLPDHAIEPALTWQITTQFGQDPKPIDRFLGFYDHDANAPRRSHARWIAEHLTAHGSQTDAHLCFRSDLYHTALSTLHRYDHATTENVILAPQDYADGSIFNITP